MSYTVTNTFATQSGNVPASQLDTNFTNVLSGVNNAYLVGTLAARPAPDGVGNGRYYFATDAAGGTLYRDNGSSWVQVALGAAGSMPIAAAGGTADAITATYAAAVALTDQTIVAVVASAANATTTPTFAPNSLTAHTITKRGGAALVANDIAGANFVAILEYNAANTRWELVNPSVVLETGTWSSPTRSKDTVYQNTSGKKRRVTLSILLDANANNTASVMVGSANPPNTTLTRFGSNFNIGAGSFYWPYTFEVPNNWYYELATTTGAINAIVSWQELDE